MHAPQLDAATVGDRLRLGDTATAWLAELDAVGAPPEPVALPAGDAARAALVRLGVREEDIAEILAAAPSPTGNPELWWLLERCHHRLVAAMGAAGYHTNWQPMPAEFGATGRYFYVYVFLATLDAVRRFHVEREIPDDVSWATLGDLGRQVAIHRRTHGVGGLDKHVWLTAHFRGSIYALGRLQFNLGTVYFDAEELRQVDAPFTTGEPALGVHIPEIGPLTPAECDASYRAAGEFFPRHFPEVAYRYATCLSWLLDDQLGDYLAADSNIVKFQRGFQLATAGYDGDKDVLEFVFRRITPALDELPQETNLQRAVVAHLRAGHHWRVRGGWRVI